MPYCKRENESVLAQMCHCVKALAFTHLLQGLRNLGHGQNQPFVLKVVALLLQDLLWGF